MARMLIGEPEEWLMFLPENILKCVAFVGVEMDGKIRVGGTCFFVCRPLETADRGVHGYVITAKHVIDEIAALGRNTAYLRMNITGGDAAEWVETSVAEWSFHPTDSSVDVAVLRFQVMAGLDQQLFPLVGSATQENLTRQKARIDVGDDLFFPGLFQHHYGRKRNIPIVRTGTIAALRDEPVTACIGRNNWKEIDAYLVEARSIGGLSGSPVFVYHGRVPREGSGIHPTARFFLLGMMQGHYDVDPFPKSDSIERPEEEARVNMGIGIVVPIEMILEVVAHPDIRHQDDAAEAAFRRR